MSTPDKLRDFANYQFAVELWLLRLSSLDLDHFQTDVSEFYDAQISPENCAKALLEERDHKTLTEKLKTSSSK